jgi:hypothetical protein
VSREPDNGAALALAQLARRAADVVALRRRANHYFAAGRRGGVFRLRAWQHDNDRPGASVSERVSVAQIVGAEVDSKAPCISVPNPCKACRVAMMRIGKTTLALVCRNQLPKLDRVDGPVNLRQIARLIVAPQLTVW